MADMYAVNGDILTGIADAIRTKTGSDEQMTVASMASAIEGISGGGSSDARIATGEMTITSSTSITIEHNLGTTNVFAFWIANDMATINNYSQFYGCFLPKEAIVKNTWINGNTGDEYDLLSSFSSNNMTIGWTGYPTSLTNFAFYGNNVRTAVYDNDGFVNDGNTLVIKTNNRGCQIKQKYRWFVISLD